MTAQRYTPDQMRRLHAVAARRGLTHEDLRACAGVASLRELTRDRMARLIDRLESQRPTSRRRRANDAAPTIGATKRIRRAIFAVAVNQLGWSRADLAGWLRRRHGVASLDALFTGPLDARRAVAIKTQLDNAARRTAR